MTFRRKIIAIRDEGESRGFRAADLRGRAPCTPPFVRARQRQAKAEELTRRIKEGAIPVISAVEGFMGYYVVYAPDDTVIAISLFNNYAAAEEFEQACAGVDRARSRAAIDRAGYRDGRAGDRAYAGLTT